MLPLIETFWDTANRYPERAAIIDTGRRINYCRLASLVKLTALWLNSNGLSRGDRIGIHLPNSIEYIVVYYACWRAGFVPVALNTSATHREIAFWSKDSGCKIIVSNKLKSGSLSVPFYEISMDKNHLSINGQEIHAPLDKSELPQV